MTDHKLPSLPTPIRTMWQYGQQIDHYSAEQMRAYAIAALELLEAETDAEIGRMIAEGIGQRKNYD